MRVLIPFFWCFSLWAAEVRLPEVEVTGASAPLLRHTSSPVWQAAEARMQGSTGLAEALTEAPGTQLTQNGGVGGQGVLYLRGSESRHALVVVDGFRLNDPSGTDRGYDTAFFLAPFFQDLLLLRGPAPTLYGGDATAGVVELVPRRGRKPRESVLGLSAGSFDTYQGFWLQDWGGGGHQGSLGIAHLRTHGFSRLNRKRHGASEPDGAQTTQALQASRHYWGGRSSTDLLAYGVQGQAALDGNSLDEHGDRTLNFQGTLGQTTRVEAGSTRVFLRTGIHSLRRETSTASFGHQEFQGQTRSASVWTEHDWRSFTLVSGAATEQEWIEITNLHASNDLASAFVLGRWKREGWGMELGGRGEEHQRYGGWAAYEATMTRDWEGGFSAHAKGARGYKSPSLYQLHAPPLGATPLGNPDLVPERNLSLEAGLQVRREFSAGLVAFQQDFQDLVAFDMAAGYQNRGTLRVRGLETSLVSPEHSWGQVGLQWTQLDFSHYSKTPLRRPPYLGNLRWNRWWDERWQAGLELRLVGGRRDVDASGGQARLSAYELLGASLKWLPDLRQEWTLQLGNVTDRRYEDLWGYSTAPAHATVRWVGRY